MQLFQHQQAVVEANRPRLLIYFGTGCGKTITAISLCVKNNVTPLIIVPKCIKRQWQEQVDRTWLVITKEEFRRDWDKLPKYEALVIDEFHFFANLKSQMSKALIKYQKKHQPKYFWGLTATPLTKDPMSIYNLAKHLGYNWNYWQFFQKFFTQVRMGSRMIPIPKKGMDGELINLIKKIGVTAKLEDLVDLPPQTFTTEYFDLTAEQAKAIKELDDTNFITRWTHVSQIENGFKYGGEYSPDETYDCDKTDRIKQLATDEGKIIIFCRYNAQLHYLEGLLGDLNKPIFLINGESKDRHEIVKQAEASEEAIVLIQSDCAVGYELPSFRVVVFASLSFSYVNYVQSCGRNNRINNPQPNLYIILVTKGGSDENVFKAIDKKENFYLKLHERKG